MALSEMGVSATVHGSELLALGYTVDQVVHDYGDLCQAITHLAIERDAPFSADQFCTLNRCLDNAIADAVPARITILKEPARLTFRPPTCAARRVRMLSTTGTSSGSR